MQPPVPHPLNKNLKKVRASDGPSPTQDGPHRGTAKAADALGYININTPEYAYLKGLKREVKR